MSEKIETSEKKYLIVVGGATASGKTALAIALARHFSTEIISADSRQFYQEMSIGTAKPTEAELAQAPHHFINNLSIHDYFSVGDFSRAALETLSAIFTKKNVAIMVGGTGLYLDAVCKGIDDFPETPLSIRQKWQHIFEEKGIEFLQDALQIADPQYFTTVDTQNPARLVRALAVCEATQQPFSHFRTGTVQPRFFEPIYIKTDLPRAELYERINRRVENMVTAGLVAEAESLFSFKHLTALQTVGYAELFDFFEKKYPTLEEAIEKIKQHSRNYAKRQLTWFRREDHWQAFNPANIDEIITFLTNKINKNA